MLSLLGGAGAAGAWATATILGSLAATRASRLGFAIQFTLFGALWALIPGAIALVADPPTLADLALLAGAGVACAVAALLLASALGVASITVAGPLVALEGVVAAVLAVVVGGRVGQLALAGIAVAVVGTALVTAGAARRGRAAGVPAALAAAGGFGVMLWCLASQSAPALASYLTMRLAGLALLVSIALALGRGKGLLAGIALALGRGKGLLAGIGPARGRGKGPLARAGLPPHRADQPRSRPLLEAPRTLAAMAACDLGGTLLYMAGARGGSAVATAVLAGQFGTLAALWGVARMRQPIGRLQVAGVVVLALGIASVAASA